MRRRVVWLGMVASLVAAPAARAQGQGKIVGSVYDSLAHGPLAGATVVATPRAAAASMLERTALTDDRGAFVIDSVAPGAYTLTVEHPALDSAGQHVRRRDVDVTAAGVVADLAVPSATTQLGAICGAVPGDTTRGVLAGAVLSAVDDRPVAGATVVVQWGDFVVDSTARYRRTAVVRSVVTDGEGIFRLCGVPVLRPLDVQAQLAESASGIIAEEVPAARVALRTVRLVPTRTATGGATVRGRVADARGHAIPGARIQVPGSDALATSRGDGTFTVANVPPGSSELEVLALGFYPARRRLELAVGGSDTVNVALSPVGQVLEQVRVTAQRLYHASLHRDFEERRVHGHGLYLTAADIAKRGAYRGSDLLNAQAKLWVTVDAHGVHHYSTKSFRGDNSLQWANGLKDAGGRSWALPRANGACATPIIIDGAQVMDTEDSDPLDTIEASDVYGIEVYAAGEAGAKMYGVDTNCGLIVVWTK